MAAVLCYPFEFLRLISFFTLTLVRLSLSGAFLIISIGFLGMAFSMADLLYYGLRIINLLALATCGPVMLNKTVQVHIDNLGLVSAINNQTAKDRLLMILIRRVVL